MYLLVCGVTRSLFNYLVPMLQDKQAKEEERQKKRRWACLHRLEERGIFVAGGGVERGSAGLSRSTRRDITWRPKHSLYHSWRYCQCSRCRG